MKHDAPRCVLCTTKQYVTRYSLKSAPNTIVQMCNVCGAKYGTEAIFKPQSDTLKCVICNASFPMVRGRMKRTCGPACLSLLRMQNARAKPVERDRAKRHCRVCDTRYVRGRGYAHTCSKECHLVYAHRMRESFASATP